MGAFDVSLSPQSYEAEQLAEVEAIRALTHRYGLALDGFDVDGTVRALGADDHAPAARPSGSSA